VVEADVAGLVPGAPDAVTTVRGQAAVATTAGRVLEVRLDPTDPPARPEVVEAVAAADWVVLGPGSWFTSVMPHLLVPELAAALRATPARRCLVLNLVAERGEATGMSPGDHVRALARHAGGMRLDVVLADPRAVDDVEDLAAAAAGAGARLVLRQVRRGRGAQHDPLRLAAALRDVLEGSWGDVEEPARHPASP
jgi:uncharacterized cofD-like protein